MHELVAHVARLRGPDVLLEPRHEMAIVGEAAQERHRRVAVQVHEAGKEHVPLERHDLVRFEPRARLARGKERGDPPVADGDRVVGERGARLDRQHVRGEDQRVGVFHGGRWTRFSRKRRLRREQKTPPQRGFLPVRRNAIDARP